MDSSDQNIGEQIQGEGLGTENDCSITIEHYYILL